MGRRAARGRRRWDVRTGAAQQQQLEEVEMAQPTIAGENGKVSGPSMKTRREPEPPSRRPSRTHTEAAAKPVKKAAAHARRGTTVPRRYTEAGSDPFDSVVWERRTSVITT